MNLKTIRMNLGKLVSLPNRNKISQKLFDAWFARKTKTEEDFRDKQHLRLLKSLTRKLHHRKQTPHQGKQECARRLRQREAGILNH